MIDNNHKYRVEIQQMMFVSGETNDPPIEVTSLIEDIVRGQVVEILLQANKTAHCRGSKSILPEDVIFLIRHDKAKVNRLRTYLSWKDLRKNAKDQDASASAAGAGAGGDDDDGKKGADKVDKDDKDGGNMMKVKKSQIRLPWELQFMFNEQPLENNEDENDLDEDEREANIATLKRLKAADDRTRNMTKEEYVHWSDCRQASFTFRKSKRFKDWSGISQLTEGKPHDDVIDILGFLTFEIVCSITETALKMKKREQILQSQNAKNKQASQDLTFEVTTLNKRKRLFDGPDNVVNPLQAIHIEEAWRILQAVDTKHKALTNFKGSRLSTRPILL
ncbi:similar to Saccharomyces cerevisiae YDR392W SPT3 Subunit of the SAGA and SAGA-like transcriptional regulatory complexes [Maudiozyma saulgeensis]|uniref:Similar to Saccharomyces cerevisiae YDR392W SPT3 Subunit of the SAGA and SAGA-like transcriptional regulatory complexes n=1 Tax=Maudiozyma saulgeensis TaxID=1789683 RepID=A0A1X7R1V5_9SACH|nr:similar to Saccharomyces cerevisiae YDR392W SPT3 Subunit of the SAGA and SAGA-like transcriptional regulatory complexes [Kazachstania saulgeensis]